MFFFRLPQAGIFLLCSVVAVGQSPKTITAKKTNALITIDGNISEAAWKTAPVADKFVSLRPIPFQPERPENATEIYFLYDNEGIYVGGYLHEKNKDSISHELRGRDGFGANDFIGVIFDTYYDKINGFEYFVTPLGEQMDAKQAPNPTGDSEDFSWNAVWRSAAKIHTDGWSFEMFIPYSAIRFGKNKKQDWGLNIVRRRQKSGEQLFWQPIDPTVNGFLTQEGMLAGLEDIKPPLRLQFSPYFSVYQNYNANAAAGEDKNTTTFNGGMDIKYGLSPAFTLDMTLIPDFGQVQTDNLVLNLSPFELKFADNRPFFTEGAELFNKGNLVYSRRIPTKLYNATKISGRMQNGLGIGFLNALAKPRFDTKKDSVTGLQTKVESDPLTNYNVLVLNQSLKNNSSVSLVNTNVWREGEAADANVTSALVDMYDKKNRWGFGGSVSVSNKTSNGKTTTGYAHSLYFGKVSGFFNFQLWQNLYDARYDKSDLGYLTNNNTVDQGLYLGFNWTKPSRWYNQFRLNIDLIYNRLASPIYLLDRPKTMFQNAGYSFNVNGQLKNLWYVGANLNGGFGRNDFYESQHKGWMFRDKGRVYANIWWESNSVKKLSWGGSIWFGKGTYFNRTMTGFYAFGKIRFNSKFSVDNYLGVDRTKDQAGYATSIGDTIFFSRRNVISVENIWNAKYNFNNKMGISLRARHYWGQVDPKEFFVLDKLGGLKDPRGSISTNVSRNFNFISMDAVYSWEFSQGSFINVVWKNIGQNSHNFFEKNYFSNFSKTIEGKGYNNEAQFNSLSIKIIYFLDYLSMTNKLKHKVSG